MKRTIHHSLRQWVHVLELPSSFHKFPSLPNSSALNGGNYIATSNCVHVYIHFALVKCYHIWSPVVGRIDIHDDSTFSQSFTHKMNAALIWWCRQLHLGLIQIFWVKVWFETIMEFLGIGENDESRWRLMWCQRDFLQARNTQKRCFDYQLCRW